MGVGLFSDCVFFLKVNSLPFKEKAQLKTCITANGGVISLVPSDKCTHVVVVSNAALNSSHQKTIQKHSIPIVKPDFIWRSIQENRLVEVGLSDNRGLEVNLDKLKDDKKSQFLAKFMQHIKTDIAERDCIDDEESEGEEDLPYDTEVAKYSLFQKGKETAIVEILCLSEQCSYPFKISTVSGIPGSPKNAYTINLADSSEKACHKYEQQIEDLKNKGFKKTNKIAPEAEFLASQALQKVLMGEALNVTQLSQEVAELVEAIWKEAQVYLKSELSCPLENISLHDVNKAEGILQNVRNALNKNENTEELMKEFYQCIPHGSFKKRMNDIDKKFVTERLDLCQLIRDKFNINETNPSTTPNSVGKYRALKCRIDYVDPNTEEFHRVKKEILDNNHSNEEFQIMRVFRIGRVTEAINFRSDLGNVKSLLHASSPSNFVGILSRGLLLPKIAVDDFGLERTDIGNLGSGIYFSDSISTSVKYTKPLIVGGKRVLLVCDVALGNTKDVGERDYSITEPPEGFHSLHGVRKDVWPNSQFLDDEYVVYNVNQVKMRYIVQFCISEDIPHLRRESSVTLLEEDEQITACELTEDDPVEDLPEAKELKGGLQGMNGQQIPLESIHVKARLKDLAAQVVIFQVYKNNAHFPIEAKYVFPLDSTAAVCGFEAFINGKHIVGEVKEKQQAHREYRTAISQGHGAYLMDQDSPDVFTVSVGNLPAKATVIIKITYVTELVSSYGVTFSIPGTVASWQEDQALKENTQDTVAKVGIEGDKAAKGNFSLDMSIEMPQKIENIWCSTHSIKTKQTECKAVIQVEKGSSLTETGFYLSIDLKDAYIPRMWVETHPDQDSEACMLIFQPQFENSYDEPKITICLDCSNSMEYCFQSAKQVALLALDSLYYSAINIIIFGSTYKELYLYPKGNEDKSEIKKFIKTAKPNMGATEFWKPLQSTCLLRPSSGHNKILLISDGHLQHENLVFQILKKNRNHIKLFTCGVGAKANKHMLRCLARDGAGAFEFFADKSKSSWRSQMEKHNERLRSNACTSVSIKWRLFGTNPAEPMQAPANIQSLYANESLFVYGFVPHCTQATLKAFIDNKEFEYLVSTTELQKTTGTILHKLTARAFIRDYEDGILREKEHENEMEKQKMKSFIIKLSKEHSIVTQFTSFVAVEKRSAAENENIEPNILEIMSSENVDILPYMDFKDAVCQSLSSSSMDSRSRSMSETEDEVHALLDFCIFPEKQLSTEDDVHCYASDSPEGETLSSSLLRNTWSVDDSSAGTELDVPRPKQQEFGYGFGAAAFQAGPLFSSSAYGASSGLSFIESMKASQARHVDTLLGSPSYCPTSPSSVRPSSVASSAIQVESNAVAPGAAPRILAFAPDTATLQAQGSQFPSFEACKPQRASLFGTSTAITSSLHDSSQFGLLGYSAKSVSQTPVSVKHSPMAPSEPTIQVEKSDDFPKRLTRAQPSHTATAQETWRPQSLEVLSSSKQPTSLFGTSSAFTSSPGGSLQSGLFGRAAPWVPNASVQHSPMAPSEPTIQDFPEKGCNWAGDLNFTAQRTWRPQSLEVLATSKQPTSLFGTSPAFTSSSGGSLQSGLFGQAAQWVPNVQHLPVAPSEPTIQVDSHRASRRIVKCGDAAPRMFGKSVREEEMEQSLHLEAEEEIPQPPPPPPLPLQTQSSSALPPPFPGSTWKGLSNVAPEIQRRRKAGAKRKHSKLAGLSWASFSALQCQEGYWMLNSELGKLLNINVKYLCDNFLREKGISSLGQRGKEEVLKLIATLLVLQTIRSYNFVSDITFKTLMKLDQCDTASESYPEIEKAINWAAKTDRQYSGICSRLGLGRDWEQATRQLLGLESPSSDLSLALY